MLEKSSQPRILRTLGTGTSETASRFRPTILLVWILLWGLVPTAGRAETEELPSVIMLEIAGVTPYDDDLYKAIRAQLSAAPLLLSRTEVSNDGVHIQDPARAAADTATLRRAAVVFWIQDDGTTCTLFFYDAADAPPRIQRRVLDLVTSSRPSRFETIGNAAASIIEASIAAAARPSTPKPEPQQPSQQPAPKQKKRKWLELFADYSGTLFSKETVSHGVQMGVGFLPSDHIALGMSYTQVMPPAWETDRYRLTLRPRIIDASLAARFVSGALDVRIGVAWSVDLRSFSAASEVEDITPRPGAMEDIHTLGPFVRFLWTFVGRVGVVVGLGANIALNERSYRISRDDETMDTVLKPFLTKFNWQVGLVVLL